MVKQAFYAKWVQEQQLDKSTLASFYVSNNDMIPRIQCGDNLLVDTRQKSISDGRVYAIWYNGSITIKRLYKQKDGSLLIRADNPMITQPIFLSAQSRHKLHIIGRVVHVQGMAGL